MNRFVRMFKPQFADLVATGKKCQTVRPYPKRMPQPGDAISLRAWTDKPYRSKQRILCESTITEVGIVTIDDYSITVKGFAEPVEDFAKDDGFESFEEMVKWFSETHGLPFEGIVIKWKGGSKP